MSELRMTLRVLLVLALEVAGARWAQAYPPEGWSVDLRNYGLQEWRDNEGLRMSSDMGMATTNKVIAIALGNPSVGTQTNDPRPRAKGANWEISLSIFDARTGRLNSKGGPWTSDRFFELFSTSRGNLLLLLRHYNPTNSEPGETLLLLSSTGNELKKVSLAPSIIRSRPSWNTIRVSSSGKTLLIEQVLEDGVHCKLLEADTLNTQLEWTAETGSPAVVALSDKELFGVGKRKAPQGTSAGNRQGELYVRTFSGSWTPFPESLDISHHGFGRGIHPNELAFLSEDTLVGLGAKREGTEARVLILRTDGTPVFSPLISKLPENASLSGPVTVAQDGRYFGVAVEHRPWLSHLMLDVWKMDMAFQSDGLTLLIWASSQPIPVAQVNLGSVYDVRELSFVVDEPPSLALLSRNTLKVVPVPLLHRSEAR